MRDLVMIGRSEWGATGSRGALIPEPRSVVMIHHTATELPAGASLAQEADHIRRVDRFHVVDRGWLGIGYNFLITRNGHVFEGRGWTHVGAHAGTRAMNQTMVGVAFVGNGEELGLTEAQRAAFAGLVQDGVALGYLEEELELIGHRDRRATECPGDFIHAELEDLRRRL